MNFNSRRTAGAERLLLRGASHINHVLAGRQADELIISEFMALNANGLLDEDGDHSDWIEIYNRGDRPVNLSNWYLSDNPKNLKKWRLPAVILNSGDYLLVYASGKDQEPNAPGDELHTNFRLDQKGGFLALSSAVDAEFDNKIGFSYPKQRSDISYGRVGQIANLSLPGYINGQDNILSYFTNPTPERANDDATAVGEALEKAQFNVERGFYNAPFTLELQSESADAAIIYTTDGNEPGQQYGVAYTQAIAIDATTIVRAIVVKPDTLPSDINTHTYIFLDDIIQQSESRSGLSPVWSVYGRDREQIKFGADCSEGEALIADCEVDPEIVNDPHCRDLLTEGLTDIPSLSLVMDSADTDIYLNPTERGQAWERPVSVELIQPAPSTPSAGQAGETEGFQINAGIRIQGGQAREEVIPKNSFRLYFRNEYGPGELKYPLFPDSPVESFNTLALRGGVDETFVGPDPQNATYTKDPDWLTLLT